MGWSLRFGAVTPTSLPDLVSRSVITIVLFLAYELAYWIDHYLAHRVPFLWEFHKVHHTATVLTPLTMFRTHLVDALLHANITVVVLAVANGLASYLFGKTTYQYALTDANLILVFFLHAYVHLQHTHLWISFRGVLGCILLSPAHHQVHHSRNPIHFKKNSSGLSGDLGLAVRNAAYSEEGTGSIELRRRRSRPPCPFRGSQSGRSVLSRGPGRRANVAQVAGASSRRHGAVAAFRRGRSNDCDERIDSGDAPTERPDLIIVAVRRACRRARAAETT